MEKEGDLVLPCQGSGEGEQKAVSNPLFITGPQVPSLLPSQAPLLVSLRIHRAGPKPAMMLVTSLPLFSLPISPGGFSPLHMVAAMVLRAKHGNNVSFHK